MSIAEKLTKVAENVPKVYEAGKKDEHDKFWDEYQTTRNGELGKRKKPLQLSVKGFSDFESDSQ